MSDAETAKHIYVKNEKFINGFTGAIEQELHDKKAYLADGEWQHEPDRVSWEYLGYPCLIKRNPIMGNLCGYVAVPKEHPAHGKGYDDVEVEVHGGLTYAGECSGNADKGICHIAEIGDHVYWLGFDCAHFGDLVPAIHSYRQPGGILHAISQSRDIDWDDYETYRNYEYVKAEVESLATQLKAIEQKQPLRITHESVE